MKNQDCFEISKWASNIAYDYNKSIIYILMKLHEAMTKHRDIEHIKSYVLKELNEVQ